MITYKRLKEVLKYYPDTGDWVWKIRLSKNIPKGRVAGYIGNRGYRKIAIDGITYLSSRLAWLYMKGYFPEYEVDHDDRNRANDKWSNLKHVTSSCNKKNKGAQSNSPTGIPGVRWAYKKWQASIGLKGRMIYLGSYIKFYDAVKARWKAEVKNGWPGCNSSSLAYKYLNMKRIRGDL